MNKIKEKKSFVLPLRYAKALRRLPRIDKGELFESILEYQSSGRIIEFSNPSIETMFLLIKHDIDNINDLYLQLCLNGKKGAEIRWEKHRNKLKDDPSYPQKNGRPMAKDKDKDQDKDQDKDRNKDKSKSKSQKQRPATPKKKRKVKILSYPHSYPQTYPQHRRCLMKKEENATLSAFLLKNINGFSINGTVMNKRCDYNASGAAGWRPASDGQNAKRGDYNTSRSDYNASSGEAGLHPTSDGQNAKSAQYKQAGEVVNTGYCDASLVKVEISSRYQQAGEVVNTGYCDDAMKSCDVAMTESDSRTFTSVDPRTFNARVNFAVSVGADAKTAAKICRFSQRHKIPFFETTYKSFAGLKETEVQAKLKAIKGTAKLIKIIALKA
jgi:hypothetical protein